MYKLLAFCCALHLLLLPARAQQTAEKYSLDVKYLLSLPDGYKNDTVKRWPLVIFLHGSGESGTDLEKVKVHGLPKLVAAGKKFPFIVVSPQSSGFGWEAEVLYHLLLQLKKDLRVDNDRIYLTGLSMGGFGTWNLAMKHPEEFAAIVPICGGGDTADIWKLRYTPAWCFHGAKDNVVPLKSSEKMVNALRRYNHDVKFTVYPEAMHDSWTQTYDNDSLYTWLLAQKKHRHQQVTINRKLLSSYTGRYVNAEKDTVLITEDAGTLKVKAGRNNLVLKPISETVFFWEPDMPFDVVFLKNGFVVRAGTQERYRKLAR